MNALLINLLYFIIIFVAVFLSDYIFIKKPIYLKSVGKKKKTKKSKNKKKKNSTKNVPKDMFELNYLVMKFNLDKKKMPLNKCMVHFALMNALIISSTTTILGMFDIFIGFQLLIGFIILFGLIYSIYEIYGRICVKKGWDK